MTAELVVGVDIGGTKTAILVTDRDGTMLVRRVAPTAVGAPDRAADAIAVLVDSALHDANATTTDVATLGVGVPGRVDRETGHVTLAVNLDWHDLPLGPRLQARLGIPTVVENDVRAAALGLHRRRLFGPVESLALLAIGTGISAGVVLDGELHRGALGLAGEIGHAIIERGGPRCACGNQGCFEAVAAGPAIAARTRAGWNARRDGRPSDPREQETAGAEAVFAAAAQGDEVAAEVIESTGEAVAWGIHLLALAYDVERIVLGGGVSHAGEPLIAPIRRELDRYRAASPLAAEILRPDLVELLPPGADAGAWGAVIVARDALARDALRREVGHA
ncbi:MAG TPA: ROK family protein [Candidatus Limnocylindrales bacterium]|nr:ROK family protein [Candidatus Limnocylindrales bacterium]